METCSQFSCNINTKTTICHMPHSSPMIVVEVEHNVYVLHSLSLPIIKQSAREELDQPKQIMHSSRWLVYSLFFHFPQSCSNTFPFPLLSS